MKVQRVNFGDGYLSWTVIDNDFIPIGQLEEFLCFLRSTNKSPNTIKTYAYSLKTYWLYLTKTNINWKTVKLIDISSFIAVYSKERCEEFKKRGRSFSKKTINNIIAAISSFYRFHQKYDSSIEIEFFQMKANKSNYKPFLHHISKSKDAPHHIIKAREIKKTCRTLERNTIIDMIDFCKNKRDKLIIRMLYETGMRIGQLLGLRHSDIESWDSVINVIPRENNINGSRSKSRESNTLHVSKELMDLYLEYVLDEANDCVCDYVFVNRWSGSLGRPLSYTSIQSLFRRISRKLNINVTPHMLRHTHATELLRSGWDSALVKQRLGHSSVQTTVDIYAHLNSHDMKIAHANYLESMGIIGLSSGEISE